MKQKRRAVIYARFSSHNQKEESIEQQIDVCTRYAQEKNIEIAYVYEDKATSGRNDKRESFQQMILDSSKNLFDYIIVYKNDRFARNRYDSATYKRQLKKNNVKLLSATEHIPDSSSGIILETILEGMAEYYSANLSENVKRGLYDNAKKGIPNGRVPFGYYKDENKKVCINEHDAKIIYDLFVYVSKGGKISDFHKFLMNNSIKSSNNQFINLSHLYHILSNERYMGSYIYGNVHIKKAFPAIINQEIFEEVNKIILKRRTGESKEHFFLLGFLKCAICGHPYIAASGTSQTQKIYNYYKCSTCNKPAYLSKYVVENTVKKQLLDIINNDSLIDNHIENYLNKFNAKTQIQEYQEEINVIDIKINNIVEAIELGNKNHSLNSRLNILEEEKKFLIHGFLRFSLPEMFTQKIV